MINLQKIMCLGSLVVLGACAHSKPEVVTEEEAARLDPKLVRESVVFETGTRDGAAVPEISAPRLRAVWVPETITDNGKKVVESHREWVLEGDPIILGIPKNSPSKSKEGK
jgi:hypothetical protein